MEVIPMSPDKKKIIKALASAMETLPDSKREYILGYAEGVAAMSEKSKQDTEDVQKGEGG